jgi:hypothetical protein
MKHQCLAFFLVVLACLLVPVAQAEEPVLDAITLPDQFGELHTLDDDVRIILFASDMDASKMLGRLLETNGQATLDAIHAISVNDISRMPSLIKSMFALPKMRKRSYTMWLDDTGTVTAGWQREEGAVMVIQLEQRKIVSVTALKNEADVRAVLLLSPTPQPSTPEPSIPKQ